MGTGGGDRDAMLSSQRLRIMRADIPDLTDPGFHQKGDSRATTVGKRAAQTKAGKRRLDTSGRSDTTEEQACRLSQSKPGSR